MCARRVFSVVAAVLIMSMPVLATGYYASGVTGLWNDAVTWGGTAYPVAGDTAYLNLGSTVEVDGTAEAVTELHFASWSGNSNLVTLNIVNSGSLTVSGWSYLGVAAGDVGEINVGAGSTLTCGGAMNVGFNGDCTLNVNGGTVNANGGLYTSNPWQTAGTGSGTINLNAGVVNVYDFAMSGTGLINIEAGEMRIYGLWWDATLQGLMTANQIVGYNGTQSVDISYDGDFTVLSAVPEPATMCLLALGGIMLRRKRS